MFSQLYKASEGDEAPRLPEVKLICEAGRSQIDELLNQVITVEHWAICPDLPAAAGWR